MNAKYKDKTLNELFDLNRIWYSGKQLSWGDVADEIKSRLADEGYTEEKIREVLA